MAEPAIKLASVYRRPRSFFVHSHVQTVVGVWIASSPCHTLPLGCPGDELVAASLHALEESRRGVPHPAQHEWKDQGTEVLRAAKVRSWGPLARDARLVILGQLPSGELRLEPHTNLGPRQGFEPIIEATLRGLRREDLAGSLHAAFALSR